jgi:arylsulfatase A-like enzyme
LRAVSGAFVSRFRHHRAVAPLIAVVGIVAMVGCRSKAPELRARNANIVLFSIDTWRADHLSVYGYGRPTTPALERLARDAIVFDNAFSAAPETAPSHMSMLTGIPPLVHGVKLFPFRKRDAVRPLSESFRTLAEILKADGYRTAAFTAAGQMGRDFGFARGFDEFTQDAVRGMNGNGPFSMDPSAVVAWLARVKDGKAPFFLFLHTYIPHTPYLPPPPYDTRYDPDYRGAIPSNRDAFFREVGANGNMAFFAFFKSVNQKDPADIRHLVALYDGEGNAADDAVAAILRALDAAALRENTIFIVTSDHGEEFLEHGSLIHPGELWDELIHVPLIVAAPGTRGFGRRVATPASSLDMVPTILDLVGAPPPSESFGRSLVPVMEGAPVANGRAILSEYWTQDEAKEAAPEPILRGVRSLRTSRYKLIRRFDAQTKEELYDLDMDPGEQHDVHDDPSHAAPLTALRHAADDIERVEDSRRKVAQAGETSSGTLSELRALGYIE